MCPLYFDYGSSITNYSHATRIVLDPTLSVNRVIVDLLRRNVIYFFSENAFWNSKNCPKVSCNFANRIVKRTSVSAISRGVGEKLVRFTVIRLRSDYGAI